MHKLLISDYDAVRKCTLTLPHDVVPHDFGGAAGLVDDAYETTEHRAETGTVVR